MNEPQPKNTHAIWFPNELPRTVKPWRGPKLSERKGLIKHGLDIAKLGTSKTREKACFVVNIVITFPSGVG